MTWRSPDEGDLFIRLSDAREFVVTKIFRHDEQVQVRPLDGDDDPLYVFAAELDHDYRKGQ